MSKRRPDATQADENTEAARPAQEAPRGRTRAPRLATPDAGDDGPDDLEDFDDFDDFELDDDGNPIFVVPIEEAIDLHTFQPREVLGVVDAYLDAALERGFREVRLIHGRGKGVQRANVQRSLSRDARVECYADAPQDRGGWGATLVWLRPSSEPASQPAPKD